jgi:Spy/CpxP family protein refolding chaperone
MISFFNTKTRLFVALLSVFIIGGALGFIGGQTYQRMLFVRMQKQHETERNQNPPGNQNDNQNRMLDNLQKELQLTADQRQKIDTILQQRRDLFRKDMQQIREKMRQVRDETDQQIENVMTPVQKKKFQDIRSKRERRPWMGPPENQHRGNNMEAPPPPPPPQGMNDSPDDRPFGRRDQMQRRRMADDSSTVSSDTSLKQQQKQSNQRRRFIHEEK